MQTGIRHSVHRDISAQGLRAGQGVFRGAPSCLPGRGALRCFLVVAVLATLLPGCLPVKETLLMEGTDLLDQGSYTEAFDRFNKAIRLDPATSQAYYGRGDALKALGWLEAAEHDYDRAISLEPENTAYRWARIEIFQLRSAYLDTVDLNAIEKPVQRSLRGVLRVLMRQDLDVIVLKDPEDVSARFERALLMDIDGEREEAMGQMDVCVLERPFDPAIRNERGRMLHKRGEYLEAVEDYDAALKWCEDSAVIRYDRALSLKMCGRIGEAVEDLQYVLRADSLDGEAWLILGEMLHQIGRNAEGCTSLKRSIALGIPEAGDLFEKLCR